jgi:NADH-quinone oxidoreductase subunit C
MIPDNLKEFAAAAALEAWDAGAVKGGRSHAGQVSLEIAPERIVAVCEFLLKEHKFDRLSGITGVDWYPTEPRFEVVYFLHSVERKERVRLKCRVGGEAPEIDSVTGVWPGANWYEREVFDLFGVRFRNHPNLRRIMLPEDWDGYPLRKDYPVDGYRYTYQHE